MSELPPPLDTVKALIFDVFGTVVDWRGGITRAGRAAGERHGVEADWVAFADAWRALYGPSMQEVREGKRPWTKLDDLHRDSLRKIAGDFGLADLGEAEVEDLVRAWHRLDPWPDSVPGLTRLKQRFIIAPCSNGNVALMVNMAKRGGIPWDMVLGAEVTHHYKPDPETYLGSAALLGLRPDEVMMVAAHQYDLKAAAACGLRTGFVPRPTEGPAYRVVPDAEKLFDVVGGDFLDFATKLGC